MRYDRNGAGEPLVLIHGLGSRRGAWGPVAMVLAGHHDVVAVDLPGFGDSPVEPGVDGSVEAYADSVEDLLDHLGIERAHLAGSSMGAGIALELAQRGRALSVTGFSPIGFAHRAGVTWARTLLRTLHLTARLLRPILPAITRSALGRTVLAAPLLGRPANVKADHLVADARAFERAAGVDDALARFPLWHLSPTRAQGLRDIPVTIAWGNRDRLLIYATQAPRAVRALPAARHVVLIGCGHLPFTDDPAACLDAVLSTTLSTAPAQGVRS